MAGAWRMRSMRLLVEVGLVHAAVGERDLLAHVADAVDDAAIGLVFGRIGIDDLAADIAGRPHVFTFTRLPLSTLTSATSAK